MRIRICGNVERVERNQYYWWLEFEVIETDELIKVDSRDDQSEAFYSDYNRARRALCDTLKFIEFKFKEQATLNQMAM